MNIQQWCEHVFDLGATMARAQADLVSGGQPYVVVQSAQITPEGLKPAEPIRFSGCHAEVLPTDGTLTITAARSGLVAREFVAGEWLEATAFWPDGTMRYSIRPGVR